MTHATFPRPHRYAVAYVNAHDGSLSILGHYPVRAEAEAHLKDISRFEHWREVAKVYDLNRCAVAYFPPPLPSQAAVLP